VHKHRVGVSEDFEAVVRIVQAEDVPLRRELAPRCRARLIGIDMVREMSRERVVSENQRLQLFFSSLSTFSPSSPSYTRLDSVRRLDDSRKKKKCG